MNVGHPPVNVRRRALFFVSSAKMHIVNVFCAFGSLSVLLKRKAAGGRETRASPEMDATARVT